MPTAAILFGTIGLIEPGQGTVHVSSGTYPGAYATYFTVAANYETVLINLANYETILTEGQS